MSGYLTRAPRRRFPVVGSSVVLSPRLSRIVISIKSRSETVVYRPIVDDVALPCNTLHVQDWHQQIQWMRRKT